MTKTKTHAQIAANQARTLGLTGKLLIGYDADTFRIVDAKIDGSKIVRGRGIQTQIDIHYVHGADLYEVTAHVVNNYTGEAIRSNSAELVYAEDLATVAARLAKAS